MGSTGRKRGTAAANARLGSTDGIDIESNGRINSGGNSDGFGESDFADTSVVVNNCTSRIKMAKDEGVSIGLSIGFADDMIGIRSRIDKFMGITNNNSTSGANIGGISVVGT